MESLGAILDTNFFLQYQDADAVDWISVFPKKSTTLLIAPKVLDELDETSQQENVSLTVYETNPRKLVNLTPNHTLISEAMDDESPGGRTGIGRGLRVGLDSVQNDPSARVFALKSIVVMTDGNQNEGVGPEVVALKCLAAGVIVHAITFSEGADEALMKGVAETTGGIHIHAESDAQLIAAFQTIARQIQED